MQDYRNRNMNTNDKKRIRSLELWREREISEKLKEVNLAGDYTWTLKAIREYYVITDSQLNGIRKKYKLR